MESNHHNQVPSRKRSTWINLAGNQGLVLLTIVRNLVLIPIYLKYIEIDVFGVWLAFIGVISFASLGDLGLNTLLVQRTANLYAAKELGQLGRTIGSVAVAVTGLAVLVFILFWAMAPWIPAWMGVKGTTHDLVLAFRLGSLDAMLMVLVFGSGAVLLGLQSPKAYMTGIVAAQVVGIGAIWIGLWWGWGVVAIPMGMLAGTALALAANGMALWTGLRKVLPAGSVRFDLPTLRGLLKSSSLLLLGRLCRVFTTRSYGMIIAIVLSAPLVVVFEVTYKAALTLSDILGRLSMSLLPGLSHILGTGEKEKFQEITLMLLHLTIVLSLLGLGGVMLLNREFVGLWTGAQYYGGDTLTALFCLYAFTQLINSALYNVIFAAGMIKVVTWASLCEASLQVSLSVALGYAWGLKGVALAGVVATVAALAIQGVAAVRLLAQRISEAHVFGMVLRVVLLGLAPPALGWGVIWYWSPRGWWQMIFFGVAYLITGGTFLLGVDRFLRQAVASIRPFKKEAGQSMVTAKPVN